MYSNSQLEREKLKWRTVLPCVLLTRIEAISDCKKQYQNNSFSSLLFKFMQGHVHTVRFYIFCSLWGSCPSPNKLLKPCTIAWKHFYSLNILLIWDYRERHMPRCSWQAVMESQSADTYRVSRQGFSCLALSSFSWFCTLSVHLQHQLVLNVCLVRQ